MEEGARKRGSGGGAGGGGGGRGGRAKLVRSEGEGRGWVGVGVGLEGGTGGGGGSGRGRQRQTPQLQKQVFPFSARWSLRGSGEVDLDFEAGYGVGRVGGAFKGNGGESVADEEQAFLGTVKDKLAEELRGDARRLERLAHECRHGTSGGDQQDAFLGIKGETSIGGAETALEETADGEREEEGELLLISLLWLCGEGSFVSQRQCRVGALFETAKLSFKRYMPLKLLNIEQT
jgi:hypothetical protein